MKRRVQYEFKIKSRYAFTLMVGYVNAGVEMRFQLPIAPIVLFYVHSFYLYFPAMYRIFPIS